MPFQKGESAKQGWEEELGFQKAYKEVIEAVLPAQHPSIILLGT